MVTHYRSGDALVGEMLLTDRLRVLMADDEHDQHLLISLAAERAGLDLDLTFVDDGSELLSFLITASASSEPLPDVIVLDLNMPRMGGLEVLELLSDHPQFHSIPVVTFTSTTSKSDIFASVVRGSTLVRTKPDSFEELVGFVRRVASVGVFGGYVPDEIDIRDAGLLYRRSPLSDLDQLVIDLVEPETGFEGV